MKTDKLLEDLKKEMECVRDQNQEILKKIYRAQGDHIRCLEEIKQNQGKTLAIFPLVLPGRERQEVPRPGHSNSLGLFVR